MSNVLPGADGFYAFLCGLFPGLTVEVRPPVVLDWSYGMEYAKAYEIWAGETKVGTFKTFGPKPGGVRPTLEFEGVLPGYRDGATIGLIFSNHRFVEGDLHGPNPGGGIVRTPWQRQDVFAEIPFP